jgi:hypothetical protein
LRYESNIGPILATAAIRAEKHPPDHAGVDATRFQILDSRYGITVLLHQDAILDNVPLTVVLSRAVRRGDPTVSPFFG